jgi:hypothetical protein
MRALPFLLLMPSLAAAQENVADTHFRRNFCWERVYDRAHLASHPEQRVTRFALGREPLGEPVAPGETVMTVEVGLLGEGETLVATGYCDPDGQRLLCGLEGDSGNYAIEAQGADQVLVTVGDRGMSFEGDSGFHELRPDQGDDRAFLLRHCG